MKRLFGTDGIRGVAGKPPLDPASVKRFGLALGRVLGNGTPRRVVIGRDTRESGDWLRDAVAAGLRSGGVYAVDAGVITTPGLAYCVKHGTFDAGVMISASHNPFHDNGLKVFGHDGVKLSDELERRIESQILGGDLNDPPDAAKIEEDTSLGGGYVARLEDLIAPGRFEGLRAVLDCAHGSASFLAPEVFRHYGAEVEVIGASPNGRNINLECGSLHLERLAKRVTEGGFDIGLAFDGDADRCLAVDRRGRIVDGDHILYLVGRHLHRSGKLVGDGVVATIMSNFWLEEALEREGLQLHRAPVGDKYVLEQMQAEGLVLGGEQSGHVIFLEHATTGDGILTGLMLLDTLAGSDETLEATLDGIVPCPQVLVNVPVTDKPDLRAHPAIGPCVEDVERQLDGGGRLVLRYSGTEAVTRVMVEGRDAELVDRLAAELAAVIRKEIGA